MEICHHKTKIQKYKLSENILKDFIVYFVLHLTLSESCY